MIKSNFNVYVPMKIKYSMLLSHNSFPWEDSEIQNSSRYGHTITPIVQEKEKQIVSSFNAYCTIRDGSCPIRKIIQKRGLVI